MTNPLVENFNFEEDVRRTAEAIWSLEPGECQPEHYKNDSILRELDGIVRLRDITHVIMATTSRKLDKAKEDLRKLNVAAKQEEKRGVPVSKWFITKDTLDAEHMNHARQTGVNALTLQNFRARFFNGRDYIAKRREGSFGSARNLADGSISIPTDEYIDLPMTLAPYDSVRGDTVPEQESAITVQELVQRLGRGEIFVAIAPFGAGKSLTTREAFFHLAKHYLRGASDLVPIAINLREHWGQLYADEVLERHARSLGITPRENLTVAWRMGIAVLLIDGFDEVASQAVARITNRNFMRDARAEALQPVRDLLSKLRGGVGALVCGRDHYFDSLRELAHSLGLHGKPFSVIRLGEFTEDQAAKFLKRHTGDASLPDWLPRKPLILGYLAHRRLLKDILEIDASRGFGFAWDSFLRLVCEREAAHDRAVMDAETVRHVLERLACDVRATSSGTGPITGVELAEAYRLEAGEAAGEGVLMQLQRLPGLTPRDQDPSSRSFIDEDFLSALQGSALARIVLEGAAGFAVKGWLAGLTKNGIAMAAHLIRQTGGDASTALIAALRIASGPDGSSVDKQAAADAVMVGIEIARDLGSLDCRSVVLEGMHLGSIDLEEITLHNLFIRHCIIDEVLVGARSAESNVRITACLLMQVHGVPSAEGLPPEIFQDCTGESYDDASTNAAVMRLKLPPAMKALVTVLRKLYLQAGGGRKLAALHRGLSSPEISGHIDDVVRILVNEGVLSVTNGIAHPIRRQAARVHRILAELAVSTDPVVNKVLRLR
jgi:hypothetical protein